MRKVLLMLGVVTLLISAQKEFVVGFAQDTMANDWRIAQVREAETAFKAYPFIRFIHTDAKGSAAIQVKNMEDMVEKGVDLLMVSPRDATLMAPFISTLYRRGIPVVLLSRSAATEDYTSFIHASDRQIAGDAARYMAEKMKKKGRILMLTGVASASTAKERTEGFMAVIKKYPQIEVIEKTANYLRGDAIKATEALLLAKEQFDALFAQSDSMAVGAIMVLQRFGVDVKKMVVVGIDYIPESRELIKEGIMDATFTYPTVGREGAEVAVKILKGKKVPKEVKVESTMVTKTNVERVKPIF